jgi:hypothetical protein
VAGATRVAVERTALMVLGSGDEGRTVGCCGDDDLARAQG